MNNFFHRLSHLRVRTVVVVILLATLLIAAGLCSLWLWAGKKMESIVTEQFNEQQLMLARKIADNVEVYIDFLEYQIVSYKQAFQVEAMAPTNFRAFLTLQMNYLKEFGILEIRQYDARGFFRLYLSPRRCFCSSQTGTFGREISHLGQGRQKSRSPFINRDFPACRYSQSKSPGYGNNRPVVCLI